MLCAIFPSVLFALDHPNFLVSLIFAVLALTLRRSLRGLTAAVIFHTVWNFSITAGVHLRLLD